MGLSSLAFSAASGALSPGSASGRSAASGSASASAFASASSATVPSTETELTVKLDSIEAKKPSPKSSGKIYINISQYSNLESANISNSKRLPEKPLHWFSKSNPISELNNQTLWTGKIKDNEEIKLIFSLVEEEFSDFDVDDIIGSAQLVLSNKNGKIEKKWALPVFEENTQILGRAGASHAKPVSPENKTQTSQTSKKNQINQNSQTTQTPEKSPQFVMKGAHSTYVLSFSIFENTGSKSAE